MFTNWDLFDTTRRDKASQFEKSKHLIDSGGVNVNICCNDDF